MKMISQQLMQGGWHVESSHNEVEMASPSHKLLQGLFLKSEESQWMVDLTSEWIAIIDGLLVTIDSHHLQLSGRAPVLL